jgi:hypothetical protein
MAESSRLLLVRSLPVWFNLSLGYLFASVCNSVVCFPSLVVISFPFVLCCMATAAILVFRLGILDSRRGWAQDPDQACMAICV